MTVTATDDAGNESSFLRSFDVIDDAPLIFTVPPAGQAVPSDAACQAPVPDFTAAAAASDACGAVELSQSPALGAPRPLGQHEVLVTAADSVGNETVLSAFLDVVDADDDGLCGAADNCPTDANLAQSNIDGDAAGDLCDICPADPTDTCDPSGSTAGEISAAAGGSIQTPDGMLTLDFEPGDLAADTTISVTETVVGDPAVDLSIGLNPGLGQAIAVYDLEPDGLVFSNPVTLTIVIDLTGYKPNQLDNLDLYLYTDTNGDSVPDKFVAIGAVCTVVDDIATCSAEIDHFSRWAAIVPLDSDGHPLPYQGFDPRAPRPAEIVGWIESSQVDAVWTVKLRVEVAGEITLQITRGQGLVIETLIDGHLEPGDYEYTWDGSSGHGRYFVKLVAGEMIQKAMLIER